jgi:antitoxin MazE
MNLLIAKWGNSLAVRIPADFIRQADLKAGDTIQAHVTPEGGLNLLPVHFSRKAFCEDIQRLSTDIKPGHSVMDELRRNAAY